MIIRIEAVSRLHEPKRRESTKHSSDGFVTSILRCDWRCTHSEAQNSSFKSLIRHADQDEEVSRCPR